MQTYLLLLRNFLFGSASRTGPTGLACVCLKATNQVQSPHPNKNHNRLHFNHTQLSADEGPYFLIHLVDQGALAKGPHTTREREREQKGVNLQQCGALITCHLSSHRITS